ncbi:MAG TPA: hypothetical protein VFB95_14140 [Candidatus Cryosericum sp.]|nr:hypothetical protein [Candidatus Cryosericum sp.]
MTDDTSKTGRDCDTLRPLIQACARGDLDAAREEALVEHAVSCTGCRAALEQADPAAIFTQLRGRVLPSELWQGFDRSLRERLEVERQEAGPWSRAWEALGSLLRPPRLAYAAPLAIVFLLGVTIVVTRPGALFQGPRTHRPGGQRSPYAVPVVPRHGAQGGQTAGALPPQVAGPRGAALEPPPLEEVRSPAARIYRFDFADRDSTAIYMVVDETIEF